MAEHASIKDPDIHEPKGIEGVAQGFVYVTTGDNSGVWTDTANSTTVAYARKDKVSSSAPASIAVGNGTDPLRNYDDYVSVLPYIDTQTISDGITITAEGNFQIITKGLYEISVWFSLNTDVDANTAFARFKNQLAGPMDADVLVARMRTKTNSDIITVSASNAILLDVGDVLGLAVASETAGNVTILDGSVVLNLLKEIIT